MINISQQDLLTIVERASTLSERLSSRFIPDQTQVDEKLINTRLETWCQLVAQGNPEKFALRLDWDSLNKDAVANILGNVRLADNQQIPAWTDTLKEALQTELNRDDLEIYRCLDPNDPIPFEEIYLPFVQVARQRLLSQVGASWHLLSEAVQITLERQLLGKLGLLCTSSLQFEFSLFKALKQSSFTLLVKRLQDNDSNKFYRAFAQDFKAGKLLSFFQKYSVLARLVATLIDLWVEEKAEFLARLSTDLAEIEQTFDNKPGQVTAIRLDLSDPHNRRRSVIALTFASGLKLVYKPRGLSIEATYFQLLSWCNQQNVLLPFKLLKVIDCQTHGWMEYVEHLPCDNKAAAERYYQRAGMLLCLLYVLQGNDCHNENLIASGEHPVLIDLETLVHPQAREIDSNGGGEEAQTLVTQQFFDSVLRTGLLPRWEMNGNGGQAEDISGLGGVAQPIPAKFQKWKNVNTDNMVLGYEVDVATPQANALLLNGTALLPSDYADELVDGFQQMYQFLLERREALLSSDSPLLGLANQKVRFLFRPTNVYGQVLMKIIHPKFLRYGVDRSIELDVLSRAFLQAKTKPLIWPLLSAELQASEQMDIPYFAADSSSDALAIDSDLTIKSYFQEPSYDRMISHLQQLNETDLAQQIAIIRGSLYARGVRGMTSSASIQEAVTEIEEVTPLTQNQLVDKAREIARELQQRAIQDKDGSVTWIGLGYLPQTQRFQLQPLGYNLYDGVSGIALFLAALAKITGEREFRDLALNALKPLKETFQNIDSHQQSRMAKQMGIGGGSGIGSIIYPFVRISQFLNEPELLKAANNAASLITPESIALDRQFDLIAGSGGAILALLTLYQAEGNPTVLEQAQACGYHLLNHRTASQSGLRAWATIEDKLATGLSHGAAGIAYALLRLYQTTGESTFHEAATEAIAFERSVFCPNVGNWADIENDASFMTSWCHGAPGIGLARLGSLAILNTAQMQREIAIALETTQKIGLQPLDHLCCGNFGRLELFLVAASKLSKLELGEVTHQQAAQILARVRQTGSFYLFPELSDQIYNPGFFQGTAGIGYELLRLAAPEKLPSVLIWE